jgi:heterotetrameric sarcosine oxidase gamma subunit
MTAISPLQFIHRKGLFGDHHKKNEKDLINISEVKNLNMVQIFQYKKSKAKLESMNIDGLNLSSQSLKVLSNQHTRILWSSPNTWLVMSNKEDIFKIINQNCNDNDFALTDISHSRAIIQIKGFNAKEILKKGCPVNFNEFEKNKCVGSIFHGINIIVDCIENEPQIFNLIILRSFGESFYHHLTDASLEFGYIGV